MHVNAITKVNNMILQVIAFLKSKVLQRYSQNRPQSEIQCPYTSIICPIKAKQYNVNLNVIIINDIIIYK